MSRKDYKAIAEVIKRAKSIKEIQAGLIEVFLKDNSNFKPDKFINACNG